MLEEYELVTKVRNKNLGNYMYFLDLPIDTEEEFYAKYPQALTYYTERQEALAGRKEASEQAKATVLEQQAQRETDYTYIEW